MAWKSVLFCNQHCHGLLEIHADLLPETHFVGISERERILFTTHEKLPGMKCSAVSSRTSWPKLDYLVHLFSIAVGKKNLQSCSRNTTQMTFFHQLHKWHKIHIAHRFSYTLFAVHKTKQVLSTHSGIDSPFVNISCCAHCECSGLIFPGNPSAGFEGP